jgi:hypothetical protein
MPNSATASRGGDDDVPPDAVTDAVETEVAELHRIGVTRAQAVDSLHTVANELIQHLITPTPGPAQRNALTCAEALRAAGAFHRHTALTRAAAVPTRSRRVEIRPRTPRPTTPRPHLATGPAIA